MTGNSPSDNCTFSDVCTSCPVKTALQAYVCSAWLAQKHDNNLLDNSPKNPDHLDVINLIDYMSIEYKFCQWHNTAYPQDFRFVLPHSGGSVLPFINTQ